MGRYDQALILAAKYHEGQTRRDGSAYVLHPIRVAEYLRRHGYDEDYQIAALLHDILEDTVATEAEVAVFGEHILAAVKLLSKNYYPADLTGYVEAILANPMATAIKNADRIDNLTDSLTCDDRAFMIHYLEDSETHYRGKFSEELDTCIENLRKCISQRKKGQA